MVRYKYGPTSSPNVLLNLINEALRKSAPRPMPQRPAISAANAWVVSCFVISVRSTYLRTSFGVAVLGGNFKPHGIVWHSCLCRCERSTKAGSGNAASCTCAKALATPAMTQGCGWFRATIGIVEASLFRGTKLHLPAGDPIQTRQYL